MRNRMGRASGGGGGITTNVDATARLASTANATDIAALQTSQTAQDALIAAQPTKAQVDALQAVQDAEDPYSTFSRQADGSIDWTRESGATGSIAAPVVSTYDDTAILGRVATLETSQTAQDTEIATKADGTATTAAITALNLEQDAQDALIAAAATQAQITALQTQITANVDKAAVGFVREADNSITVTWDDASTTTLPAPMAAAPEVKDATPTAGSTNAVESQGIDAALGLKADQSDLDAEIARATTAENTKEPLLPADTALRFLRRNAANDGWELADIPVSPANLISGPGVPGAAVGDDGFYYLQADAAKGTNDIWGPKAGGAWPAQADFKSADPDESVIGDFADGAARASTPLAHSPNIILEVLRNSLKATLDTDTTPLDWSALGLPENMVMIAHNGSASSVRILTWDSATLTGAVTTVGTTGSQTVTNGTFSIPSLSSAIIEHQGTELKIHVFQATRVTPYANLAAANGEPMAFNEMFAIGEMGGLWKRVTSTNTVNFDVTDTTNFDRVDGGSGMLDASVNETTTYVVEDLIGADGSMWLRSFNGTDIDATFVTNTAAVTFRVVPNDGSGHVAYASGNQVVLNGKSWRLARDGNLITLHEMGGANIVGETLEMGQHSFTYNAAGQILGGASSNAYTTSTYSFTIEKDGEYHFQGSCLQDLTLPGGGATTPVGGQFYIGTSPGTSNIATLQMGSVKIGYDDDNRDNQDIQTVSDTVAVTLTAGTYYYYMRTADPQNITASRQAHNLRGKLTWVGRSTGEEFVAKSSVVTTASDWVQVFSGSVVVPGNLAWTNVGAPQSIITGDIGDEMLVEFGSGNADSLHYMLANGQGGGRRMSNNYRCDVQILAGGQIQVRASDPGNTGIATISVKKFDARVTLPPTVMVDTTGIADGETLIWDAANSQFVKGAAAASGDMLATQYEFTSRADTSLTSPTLTGSAAIKAQGYMPVSYQVHIRSGADYIASDQVGPANGNFLTNCSLTRVDTAGVDLGLNFYATGTQTRSKQIVVTVHWSQSASPIAV